MRKKRVLIVDDQAELRKLVRMTLDFGDYDLYEAECGQRALELAAVIKPDLLLLDVMMPGALDGYQVCKKLKETTQGKVPYVILLTARGQKKDLEEGARVNADSYMIKPFSPLELIDNVNNSLSSVAFA